LQETPRPRDWDDGLDVLARRTHVQVDES
jgi:hypothetical protein